MAGFNSGRIATTFPDKYRQLEKAVMRDGQRAQPRHAADFMGPVFGPKAVEIRDWNDEAARFNGIVWSPGTALNVPDDTRSWIGRIMGTPDGFGIQEAYTLYEEAETLDIYIRQFYTPVAETFFTAWSLVSST